VLQTARGRGDIEEYTEGKRKTKESTGPAVHKQEGQRWPKYSTASVIRKLS